MNEPMHAALATARALVSDVLEPMKRAFIGKDEVIDLLGLALVAGENLFLLGPPGTAKSALVKDLARRLDGRAFDYLLTRFTEPSELFGPFDIRRLREGELVTNTEGMLPEADFVFLDELLNANSAILNGLLGVLNERVLRRGKETFRLPTLLTVGASNHLPEESSLAALFDRFLVRVHCDNVPNERIEEVLRAGWLLEHGAPPPVTAASPARLRALRTALAEVELTPALQPYVRALLRLRAAGLPISDRRAVKLQRLVAASALLAGRAVAETSDLWVLRYVWDHAEQREVLAGIVDEVLATASTASAHPRARAGAEPDPEALRAELDEVERRFGEPAERTACADRLALVSARAQWVRDDTQRAWLTARSTELWARVEARE